MKPTPTASHVLGPSAMRLRPGRAAVICYLEADAAMQLQGSGRFRNRRRPGREVQRLGYGVVQAWAQHQRADFRGMAPHQLACQAAMLLRGGACIIRVRTAE